MATIVLVAVASGSGCVRVRVTHPEPEPFAAHIVESKRIRGVMKNLLALVPEDPNAFAASTANDAELRTAIRASSLEIAAEAGRIEKALARRELPASQRATFLALADLLRGRANDLAGEAADAPPERLQAQFGRVLDTCHACHDSFRGARDS